MRAQLVRRVALAVPTLLGVTLLVFLMAHVGGDPAMAAAGEKASAAELERVRRERGFDRPILEQYFRWLAAAARGDLGRSLRSDKPVMRHLREAFPATIELATAALAASVLLGVLMGVLAAMRPGSVFDLAAMSGSLIGVSIPVFFLGMILLVAFHGLLPQGGRLSFVMADFQADRTGFVAIDALLAGRTDVLADHLRHLVLPALALATIPLAVIARMTRASMLEVLTSDYVRTARAKGLSPARVVARHALRNALIPIVTTVGLQYGTLLAGAVLTETVFSWPGVGTWLVRSIGEKDFPAVQAGVLVIAVVFVAVNLVVDLLYGWIDPRVAHA
jgi:ABC-type dipeptide/oligopeptide/nickel transport system permease component